MVMVGDPGIPVLTRIRRCSHWRNSPLIATDCSACALKYSPVASLSVARMPAPRHHQKRQVIPFAVFRIQNVVAQAQPLFAALPSEAKLVNGLHSAWSEQLNRVAGALGFEKLPHRPHLHKLRGFVLQLFHLVVKRQRFFFVLQ